ncbi:MAG: RCC1 domain-containing protein [Oscillospiraceae bacterium]
MLRNILKCAVSILVISTLTACDINLFGTSSSIGDSQNLNIKDVSFNINEVINNTVVTTTSHTVALKNDGTVIATGSNIYHQCDVQDWTDIVSISASDNYTIGLKENHTIEVTNYVKSWNNFNLSEWIDLADIYSSNEYLLGIKLDGTILVAGNPNGEVSNWNDIVKTSRGLYHMAKLNDDGSVTAVGENGFNQCEVKGWKDIIEVSATNGYPDVISFESYSHTVGLKSDGTVLATGYNGNHQCDVQSWTDIVSIATGTAHTVGLKRDGTVVATGNDDYSQCEVSNWKDVVAIYTANHHTVGLKRDGTLIATGDSLDGQCNVDTWKDIQLPN